MAAEPSGRIFISYRRSDTQYVAGWLYDRLQARFGAQNVFLDIVTIEAGQNYNAASRAAAAACDVLLALIGPRWLDAADARGRRLDMPNDLLVLEISAALRSGKTVIPVLVEAASAPRREDLPEPLAELASHQGAPLRYITFDADVTALIARVSAVLTTQWSGLGSAATENSVAPGPDFRGQDLTGRDLRRADLRGAVLRGMILRNADFSGADLTGADFTGVRLTGGSVRGADTTGSRWDRAALIGVDGIDDPAGRVELEVAAVAGRDRAVPMTPATGAAFDVAFSPDGTLLAIARSGGVEMVDLALLRTLGMPGDRQLDVQAVAFSPDSSELAMARRDGAVCVSVLSTGHTTTFRPHSAPAWDIAFAGDGQSLATASVDGAVLLIDRATGDPLATVNGHSDPVRGLAFSPDGTWLATELLPT